VTETWPTVLVHLASVHATLAQRHRPEQFLAPIRQLATAEERFQIVLVHPASVLVILAQRLRPRLSLAPTKQLAIVVAI